MGAGAASVPWHVKPSSCMVQRILLIVVEQMLKMPPFKRAGCCNEVYTVDMCSACLCQLFRRVKVAQQVLELVLHISQRDPSLQPLGLHCCALMRHLSTNEHISRCCIG
jgi:hypothetical protein